MQNPKVGRSVVCRARLLTTPRLRCNRAQPCEHCIKREDAGSCSYATTGDQHTPSVDDSRKKAQHTENQLHSLESLVAEAIKLHQGKTQSLVRSIIPLRMRRQ